MAVWAGGLWDIWDGDGWRSGSCQETCSYTRSGKCSTRWKVILKSPGVLGTFPVRNGRKWIVGSEWNGGVFLIAGWHNKKGIWARPVSTRAHTQPCMLYPIMSMQCQPLGAHELWVKCWGCSEEWRALSAWLCSSHGFCGSEGKKIHVCAEQLIILTGKWTKQVCGEGEAYALSVYVFPKEHIWWKPSERTSRQQIKKTPNTGIAVLEEETIFPWRMILWKKREGTERETIDVICFKIAAKETIPFGCFFKKGILDGCFPL